MRCLRVAMVVVTTLVVGCGGGRARPAAPETPSTSTPLVLEHGADSGKVDKVGLGDGALQPDGVNDLGFRLTLDGAVRALFLVAVDPSGASNGQYEADTLVGDQEVPKVIATKWGSNTAGLGVAVEGKIVNHPSGSLGLPASARRELALYVSPPLALAKGARLRAYVLRPGGEVEASNIVILEPAADAGG